MIKPVEKEVDPLPVGQFSQIKSKFNLLDKWKKDTW